MHLTAGNVIDNRYEIVCPIASGGFAVVYKAYQKQFDRYVAIKVLDRYAMDDDDAVPRFEREAKAVSALRHRNIVSMYGYGIWQCAPYMVMELVEGQRLEDVINAAGKLEAMRATKLMLQVCEALGEAHKNGIIHRDLKPSNIMVAKSTDGSDVIKIIDFGLAKLLPGYGLPAQKLTETGTALGTCTYMAPEQCTGQPVDARADLYSAGCILYQCLAGKPPFAAEAQVAVMFMHLNEQHTPPLSASKRDIAANALNGIVAHALAKDPNDRYQTAADFTTDLTRVIARKPPQFASGVRSAITPRIRRISTAQCMILLVVAAATTLWFVFAYHARQPQPDMPEQSSLDLFKKVSVFDPSTGNRHERMLLAQQALVRNDEDHRLDAERLLTLHRMITAQLIAEQKLTEATKQNALAVQCAKQLGKRDGETVPEILHWANICSSSGYRKKGETLLLEVIDAPDSRFAPKHKAQARFELAISYSRTNRWDDAIKVLQKNLYPLADEQLMLNSRLYLGVYLTIRGRNNEAMRVIKQAITMCGDDRPIQLVAAYARLLMLNKEYAQAYKILHELPPKLNHGSYSAHNIHAQRLAAAARLHLRREAEAELEELMKPDLLCDEPLVTKMDDELCEAALKDAGYTDLITRIELHFMRQNKGT